MKRVVIFGGRGFVGSCLVSKLKNFKVYTFGSGKSEENHISGDITKIEDVEIALKKGDIVVNLVGLSPLRKPFGKSYNEVHIGGVRNLVEACRKKKCRLIHMSALGAEPNAETEYLRTKGVAEEIISNSNLDYCIFCPSVIYDKESELIKLLEKFSRFRFFPQIDAKIQPVFRGDVADLFVLAIRDRIKQKKIEFGGPKEYSIYEFAKIFFNSRGKNCFPVPKFIVKTGIYFAIFFRIKGITRDNLSYLKFNNTTENKVKMIKFISYEKWLKNY